MPAAISKEKSILVADSNPSSRITESYRQLRTNVQFASVNVPKSILITSVLPEAGAATTISNLAVVFAQEGKRVLVIDADLRNPVLHKTFPSNGLGLSNVLLDQCLLADVVTETQIPQLSFISAGRLPINSLESITLNRMKELLSRLEDEFDIILISSSPILEASETQVLAALSNGVIIIMSQGKVKRNVAIKAVTLLNHVKANVLGVVMVNSNTKNSH